MARSPADDPVFRWTPWVVLAFVALWPTVGPAEAVLSLGALASLAVLSWRRFRDGTALIGREAWALVTALFFCYWLPQLFSAFDAIDSARAWREVLQDLRYLPFMWLVAIAVAARRGRRIVFTGLGVIALFWTLDAAVQAMTGYSLGGQNTSDRLSGIFGADNLKLGLVLAALSPFALDSVARRFHAAGWIVVALLLGSVLLLAGSRGSWLMYGLVMVASGWRRLGRNKLLIVMAAGALLGSLLAFSFSAQFADRIERSAEIFSGDAHGLDEALSGRWSIWRAAAGMIAAHPINGVGTRGFRDAYAKYAAPDDFWLSRGQSGALHAHQIVMEVLAETGLIGLGIWLMGAALALRAWRWAMPAARARSAVPALALAVTAFPLNTSLAFYSNFWGGVFLLLLALFAGALFALEDDEVAKATSSVAKAEPASP
jgi:O-antigen ligase